MIKIGEINQKQFKKLLNSSNPQKVCLEIVGLKKNARYELGDTAMQIKNAKPLDVYKQTVKGYDFYYIVLNVIEDLDLAVAYSLYPVV